MITQSNYTASRGAAAIAQAAALLVIVLAIPGCMTSAPPADQAGLRDCPDCPELVTIPAGRFAMGRDGGEPDRYDGPVRDISIRRDFLIGKTEVTHAQFREFVSRTGYKPATSCNVYHDGSWGMRDWANWMNPGVGREPRDNEPVTCVSWNDAKSYVDWLRTQTGKPYRLPSEAEFEYAARAGSNTEYPWGDSVQDGCLQSNMLDRSAQEALPKFPWEYAPCSDGYAMVSPVASLQPNPFGLYDIVGNVWEWTQDCYVLPYPPSGPVDGSALEVPGQCERRTVRGGSWETRASRMAVAFRGRDKPDEAFRTFGFRVARDN